MHFAFKGKRPEISQRISGELSGSIHARLDEWQAQGVGRKIWEKDGTVWVADPQQAAATPELTNRLDWLELPEQMSEKIEGLEAFAAEIRQAGFSQVVLLGMGGSSLAPEVFMSIFGNRPGSPTLLVLDSTEPGAVQQLTGRLDLKKTLFLVSSKSGGTLETSSFYKYFYSLVSLGSSQPGLQFAAITDPGSSLEKMAREKKFRRIFSSPPGVGGRFSALTEFGLVPAALLGMDLTKLLERAVSLVSACQAGVPAPNNPGLVLGAALGELALAGRNKLTLLTSPAIAPFNVWVEQLVAESTGKNKTGIVPVVEEIPGTPAQYGQDRVFVYTRLEGDRNQDLDQAAASLEAAGHPMIRIELKDKYDLGGEFFVWELATAAAGAVLKINPFDQPDVELAKRKARELMQAYKETGELPKVKPRLQTPAVEAFSPHALAGDGLKAMLQEFLSQVRPGDYLALMAYLPMTPEIQQSLQAIRHQWRGRFRLATTLGFGPRFLHSTGQLHKGDSNQGVFIQITRQQPASLPIPGEPYGFETLVAAQAQGDYQALEEKGRRLLRLHIVGELEQGLAAIAEAAG